MNIRRLVLSIASKEFSNIASVCAMTVTIETVLQIYEALLVKRLTYDQADQWTWKMMELQDVGELIYEPPANEPLIWEPISFLYGIDIPSMTDRSQPARGDLDIVDFLKERI